MDGESIDRPDEVVWFQTTSADGVPFGRCERSMRVEGEECRVDRGADRRTPLQRELVGRMAELGPAFERRAAQYDREASFPYENFADLRDAGFYGLCVPTRHGGLGADFVTYALVAEELGRHCGATALTFNMHTATCLLAGPVADELGLAGDDLALLDARRKLLFDGVIDGGHAPQPAVLRGFERARHHRRRHRRRAGRRWLPHHRPEDLRLAVRRRRRAQRRRARAGRRPHPSVRCVEGRRRAHDHGRLGSARHARHDLAHAAARRRVRPRRARVGAGRCVRPGRPSVPVVLHDAVVRLPRADARRARLHAVVPPRRDRRHAARRQAAEAARVGRDAAHLRPGPGGHATRCSTASRSTRTSTTSASRGRR